jgi:hypothetical protein
MSRETGVSRWTFADWESGKRSVPSDQLPSLARILHMEIRVMAEALLDRGEAQPQRRPAAAA